MSKKYTKKTLQKQCINSFKEFAANYNNQKNYCSNKQMNKQRRNATLNERFIRSWLIWKIAYAKRKPNNRSKKPSKKSQPEPRLAIFFIQSFQRAPTWRAGNCIFIHKILTIRAFHNLSPNLLYHTFYQTGGGVKQFKKNYNLFASKHGVMLWWRHEIKHSVCFVWNLCKRHFVLDCCEQSFFDNREGHERI